MVLTEMENINHVYIISISMHCKILGLDVYE